MAHPRTWLFQMLLGASVLFVTSAMAESDAPPADPMADEGSLDHYLGWYRLPPVGRKTRRPRDDQPGHLIPIFKRDGIYYTVMKWVEVPLIASGGDLVWGFEQTSMKGTTFTHDPETGGHFLIHCDAQNANNDEWYVWGERRKLHPAEPPEWLADFSAEPPATLDDMLGEYYCGWIPFVGIRLYEAGGIYWSQELNREQDGRWVERGSPREIKPLDPPKGFEWEGGPDRLHFNKSLGRYEIVKPFPEAPDHMRIPLLREDPLADRDWSDPAATEREPHIGVSAW